MVVPPGRGASCAASCSRLRTPDTDMPTSAATSSSVIWSCRCKHGDQGGVVGLVAEQRVEGRARRAAGGRIGLLGDLDEQVRVAVLGAALSGAQPVEADVGRDPEQQRRRRLIGELVGVAEDLNEDVVHGISGGLIVAEQLPAPPEHHRSVGAVVSVGIDRHGGDGPRCNTAAPQKCPCEVSPAAGNFTLAAGRHRPRDWRSTRAPRRAMNSSSGTRRIASSSLHGNACHIRGRAATTSCAVASK